jgi:hypothetical protein
LSHARPGTLSFGSAGVGTTSHFTVELFKLASKADITHIPYKGAGPAMIDTMAGFIPLVSDAITSMKPHLDAGKLRGIAISSAQRSEGAPQLATFAESGYPGFEASTWWGILVPARTPAAVIARLNSELNRALEDGTVRKRMLTYVATIRTGRRSRIGLTPHERRAMDSRSPEMRPRAIRSPVRNAIGIRVTQFGDFGALRHQQRIVGALLLGQATGEHVAGVGERLDLVEHARRRVLDAGQRQGVGQRLELFDHRQPVPAARDDDSHRGVGHLVVLDQRLDVRAHGVEVDRQAQVGRRAPQPLQVVLEREQPPAVEAHDLEDAVAAQEAVVRGGDLRLRGVDDGAVEDREHGANAR